MQMAPYLGPLDKELVKTILKLLRSASFLGTAQLLSAVASTDADMRMPVGLLKVGATVMSRPAHNAHCRLFQGAAESRCRSQHNVNFLVLQSP